MFRRNGEAQPQIGGGRDVLDIIVEMEVIVPAERSGIVPQGFVDPGLEPLPGRACDAGGKKDGGSGQFPPGEALRFRPQRIGLGSRDRRP